MKYTQDEKLRNQIEHLRSRGIDDINIFLLVSNKYDLNKLINLLGRERLQSNINQIIYDILIISDMSELLFLSELKKQLP